jgi:hypothetical protein
MRFFVYGASVSIGYVLQESDGADQRKNIFDFPIHDSLTTCQQLDLVRFDPICPVMSMELLQFYYSDCSGEVVPAFDRNHHDSVCVTFHPAANRAILVGSPFLVPQFAIYELIRK